MPSNTASGQLHKIIEIVGLFSTAGPIFFEIVENWSSFVVFTCLLVVFCIEVILQTSFVDAFEFALFCYHFFLLGFWLFFNFLFLLLFCIKGKVPLLYWLISLITTFFAYYFLIALAAFVTVPDLKNYVAYSFTSVCFAVAHLGNFSN